MEWEAPGIVLTVRPYGEADAIAATFTVQQGRHLGLARGGLSRRQAALWQPGNLARIRWVGRLQDQLGSLTAELIHPTAALVLDDALALAMLAAACAVTDAALPERLPHPRSFSSLLAFIAILADPWAALVAYARFEFALIAEIGFGLDLARCARTGVATGLAYVSPRTGRAVTQEGAGDLAPRLLRLPAFLPLDPTPLPPGTPHPIPPRADLLDALRLTGHFLARALAAHHRPLPEPRQALYDRLLRLSSHDPQPEPPHG